MYEKQIYKYMRVVFSLPCDLYLACAPRGSPSRRAQSSRSGCYRWSYLLLHGERRRQLFFLAPQQRCCCCCCCCFFRFFLPARCQDDPVDRREILHCAEGTYTCTCIYIYIYIYTYIKIQIMQNI